MIQLSEHVKLADKQYADMIQLSEHVKLAEPQVIVKSCGQHIYLEE